MRIRFAIALLLLGAACSNGDEVTDVASPEPLPTGDYKTQATEWFLRSVGADGRTISIVYTMSGVASGCQQKGTTTADEFADKVVITANKRVLQGNRACTEELGYIDSSVVLNAPLGSRALVGCRPPKTDTSENSVCRDRGRAQGIPTAQPSPAR